MMVLGISAPPCHTLPGADLHSITARMQAILLSLHLGGLFGQSESCLLLANLFKAPSLIGRRFCRLTERICFCFSKSLSTNMPACLPVLVICSFKKNCFYNACKFVWRPCLTPVSRQVTPSFIRVELNSTLQFPTHACYWGAALKFGVGFARGCQQAPSLFCFLGGSQHSPPPPS